MPQLDITQYFTLLNQFSVCFLITFIIIIYYYYNTLYKKHLKNFKKSVYIKKSVYEL